MFFSLNLQISFFYLCSGFWQEKMGGEASKCPQVDSKRCPLLPLLMDPQRYFTPKLPVSLKSRHKLNYLDKMKSEPSVSPCRHTQCTLGSVRKYNSKAGMQVHSSKRSACVFRCVYVFDENNEIVSATISLFCEFIMGTWPRHLKETRAAQF